MVKGVLESFERVHTYWGKIGEIIWQAKFEFVFFQQFAKSKLAQNRTTLRDIGGTLWLRHIWFWFLIAWTIQIKSSKTNVRCLSQSQGRLGQSWIFITYLGGPMLADKETRNLWFRLTTLDVKLVNYVISSFYWVWMKSRFFEIFQFELFFIFHFKDRSGGDERNSRSTDRPREETLQSAIDSIASWSLISSSVVSNMSLATSNSSIWIESRLRHNSSYHGRRHCRPWLWIISFDIELVNRVAGSF